MSRFFNHGLKNLKPYVPGEQPRDMAYIKLNTNESPFAPSPGAAAVINGAAINRLRLYPDPEATLLTEAAAKHFGLEKDRILAGNGSDEILAFAFLAFGGKGQKMCFPDITYGFYPVFAELFGVDYTQIPLKEDFSIDAADYVNCGRNIIIANPNAPTGLALNLREIEQILASNPDNVVLIDEAYVDFGAQSAVSLIEKYDNLLVAQTFSKSRNLAGARLGLALASPPLIEDLNRIKFSFNPYNINRLSLLAGAAAIADGAYFKECVGKIITAREETARGLSELGFTVLKSKANFLFARHSALSGETYYKSLREKGVLVRHFDQDRIADFVRISIGEKRDMEIFIEKTKEILREAKG